MKLTNLLSNMLHDFFVSFNYDLFPYFLRQVAMTGLNRKCILYISF